MLQAGLRSLGYLSILSFWRRWALGALTNRFPLVWENPPTESGWKRRSKKPPTSGISRGNARDAIKKFQVRAISSRLRFTYIFAFDSGSLSIAGGWSKCGTLLIFCQTGVLVCLLQLQEKQEALVKEFAVARFRKRPEIDPSGRLRMAM